MDTYLALSHFEAVGPHTHATQQVQQVRHEQRMLYQGRKLDMSKMSGTRNTSLAYTSHTCPTGEP